MEQEEKQESKKAKILKALVKFFGMGIFAGRWEFKFTWKF